MGAEFSGCLNRSKLEWKASASLAMRTSDGRRQLLECHAGEDPSEGYEVGSEVIGEGSFGAVRVVISRKTRASCALKTIQKSWVNHEKLRCELDIVLGLDHPHIVRLFDVYEDRSSVYMVFELCSGGEVLDELAARRRFSESEALLVLAQLLYAINYIHSACVVHRDIKLENMLFKEKAPDLSQGNVKVIDFGMARRFLPGTSMMSTMVGSPVYVAPEVLAQDTRYNEKCDIWSAGVAGYILLSSVPPFHGHSSCEILRRVRNGSLRFPSDLWGSVSKRAKSLIKSMIKRDVAERPDAQEALDRLSCSRSQPYQSSEFKRADPMDIDDVSVMPRKSSKGSCPMPNHPQCLPGIYVRRLAACGAESRFVKSARHLIARRVEEGSLHDIQDVFKLWDADGDGTLTLCELKQAFANAGFGSDEASRAFSDIDTDHSDRIDYTEFVAALIDHAQCTREELCWEAFRVFDKDHDGHISIDDLSQTLESSDHSLAHMSVEEAEELILRYDHDGDKRISFPEFLAMMQQHTNISPGTEEIEP